MCHERQSRPSQPRTLRAALAPLWALGLSAVFLSGQSMAQEPPASVANQRLEALRNALMDKALKAPTRVRSAAWVDESGILHENLRIDSDIKLRGTANNPAILGRADLVRGVMEQNLIFHIMAEALGWR